MLGRTGVAARLFLAVLLVAGGCSKTRPILDVEDHPIPPNAQNLSLEEIGRTIAVAGAEAHWRIEPVAPGRMTGRYDRGEREAVVDITYSQTSYTIGLASSTNLQQEGDEIHKKYNKWVRSLEHHIDRSLRRAGSGAQ